MEKKEKDGSNSMRCYGCFAYKCYYTKAYMRFTKEKTGYCTSNKTVVGHKETCDNWRSSQSLRQRKSVISIKALNYAIAELVELINFIKEDIESKKLALIVKEDKC